MFTEALRLALVKDPPSLEDEQEWDRAYLMAENWVDLKQRFWMDTEGPRRDSRSSN